MKSLVIEGSALEDLLFWSKNDVKLLKKSLELIYDIQKTPFIGKGKPELLKYQYKGYWSRRITDEHRLIYRVTDDTITIISARFHYSD